jgi:hypothetical protein
MGRPLAECWQVELLLGKASVPQDLCRFVTRGTAAGSRGGSPSFLDQHAKW